MKQTYHTRPAQPTDIPHLPAVENSAGTLFRGIAGLETLADDEPLSVSRLAEILETGNVWVAVHRIETDEGGESQKRAPEEIIVGFLAAFPIASTQPPLFQNSTDEKPTDALTPQSKRFLHIAELSIHASHQRRGLASRLMNNLIRHVEEINKRTSSSSSSLSSSPTSQPPTASPEQAAGTISGLTLTTYHSVPFNGPFYEKVGFQKAPTDDILAVFGTTAKRIWDKEQAAIPLPEDRAWMILWTDPRVEMGGKG